MQDGSGMIRGRSWVETMWRLILICPVLFYSDYLLKLCYQCLLLIDSIDWNLGHRAWIFMFNTNITCSPLTPFWTQTIRYRSSLKFAFHLFFLSCFFVSFFLHNKIWSNQTNKVWLLFLHVWKKTSYKLTKKLQQINTLF